MRRAARRWRLAIVAAGVLLMAAGVLRGESEALYWRATFVCMECVGIG